MFLGFSSTHGHKNSSVYKKFISKPPKILQRRFFLSTAVPKSARQRSAGSNLPEKKNHKEESRRKVARLQKRESEMERNGDEDEFRFNFCRF